MKRKSNKGDIIIDYKNGIPVRDIMKKYKTSGNTIIKIIKRNNVPQRFHYTRSDIDFIALIDDYNNMMKYKDILKKYSIVDSVFYRILRRFGIKLRGYGYNAKNKIPHIKKNYINQQILYGSLLGDGHINKSYHKYEESHCFKQRGYIIWKNKYLCIRTKHNAINKYDVYSSRNDQWIKELRKLFYPNGKKVVTREILDKVDKLGLLIWYLDDGGIDVDNRSAIATNCFTYKEHKIMQKWFKDKWDIDVKIYTQLKYYYIKFPVKSTKKLLSILQPIFKKYKLPKCMKYKLWRE